MWSNLDWITEGNLNKIVFMRFDLRALWFAPLLVHTHISRGIQTMQHIIHSHIDTKGCQRDCDFGRWWLYLLLDADWAFYSNVMTVIHVFSSSRIIYGISFRSYICVCACVFNPKTKRHLHHRRRPLFSIIPDCTDKKSFIKI